MAGFAGEWTPTVQIPAEDKISRLIRRDAWASWWRHTDGPMLLAALSKHTLTPDKGRKVQALVTQLGSDDFTVREDASRQLQAFGRLVLPRLREACKDRDAEVARRAKLLIERLENGPDTRLPLAALRLLALRKPTGAGEALLASLPFTEDEEREDAVRNALANWRGTLPASPVNVQRLPNGNTFIVLQQGAMLEVNRAGKEIYQINNIPGVLAAYRTLQGPIVCVTNTAKCILLDTTGKQLKSFAVKYPVSNAGCLDLLPNGRILIASNNSKVMEYHKKGTLLHEWDSPNVTTPTGLANGHILAASQTVNQVVELNRAGKVVWQQTKISAY